MSSKTRKSAEKATEETIENIKRVAIVSLISDDTLFEKLVLKGGNAINFIHGIHNRASSDIDFSTEENIEEFFDLIKSQIESQFKSINYHAFGVGIKQRPKNLDSQLKSFWGGYLIEFKLISLERASELSFDNERMTREALMIGKGSKFTIDISPYEHTEDKMLSYIDGYGVYAYTLEMIVAEKLRAICQQMEEYGPIIKRTGTGNSRARDFIDIENIITKRNIDISKPEFCQLVEKMFLVKKVDLSLIKKIKETRDFHIGSYDTVVATMDTNIKDKDFDYYFNFVINEVEKLKPLWDK